MAWVPLNSLSNSDIIDFDVLDQMINNLNYLRAAVPEIHVKHTNGTVVSASGDTDVRLRIQSGVVPVPTFKGSYVMTVNLIKPNVGTADYPIQLTLHSNADIRVSVSTQNNKQFMVRFIPVSKAAMRGVRVHWQAITQE